MAAKALKNSYRLQAMAFLAAENENRKVGDLPQADFAGKEKVNN